MATAINGVAIACLIGASFGPLNLTLERGWGSFGLLAFSGLFHVLAQYVLSLGYELSE